VRNNHIHHCEQAGIVGSLGAAFSTIENKDFNPEINLIEKGDGLYLEVKLHADWGTRENRQTVTTELLGKAHYPDQAYTYPDGSPYRIDRDYFGGKRNTDNPFPGPFAKPGESGKQLFKVWPLDSQ